MHIGPTIRKLSDQPGVAFYSLVIVHSLSDVLFYAWTAEGFLMPTPALRKQ